MNVWLDRRCNMFIKVKRIKLMYDIDGDEPTGAEVDYDMVIDKVNKLEGHIVITNSNVADLGDLKLWQFNRYIHEIIKESL
jgi:hypothetical protein